MVTETSEPRLYFYDMMHSETAGRYIITSNSSTQSLIPDPTKRVNQEGFMPESSSAASPERSSTVIRTPDQRLRVFVSSTLKELAEERTAVREAISQLRLAPVMFELGARPHPARELYRAYLQQSHIFIGIYWQQYGWVAPDMDISGLEDEYRLAGDLAKLIYFKAPAPDQEPRLNDLIAQIRDDGDVSYKYFSSAEELRELVANDLALLLTERFEQTNLRPQPLSPVDRQPDSGRAFLQRPLTPLIGRQAEAETVRNLILQPDVRLLTLTGPGGVGKTRLALAVAADLTDAFAHGVYWVNLAAIREPDLVISAVAQMLDVRERSGYSLLQSLKAYLQSRQLLLVLDNFEQAVSAGPLLSELLVSAPGLKALVTSRASLRVRGEHEFPVPPLPVPQPSPALPPERLSQVAAVRLFSERARAVQPDFSLTQENAAIVGEIVRRLDGLPLAIELAAARLKLLSPRLILDRLDERLKLLTSGAQDLPPRQQTMRSTIAWSYSLLDEQDKTLFGRLGVFVGGFTLEAAEAVCNPEGELDMLEGVTSLLGNSLLRQEPTSDERPRFGMLETIRQYAIEQLETAAEADHLRQHHATFFAKLTEEARPKMFSGESEQWLDRLEANYGNLRATLDYSQSWTQFRELGWHVLVNLSWMWYRRGYLNEARQWYEKGVAQTAALGDSRLRALILGCAGLVAMWQSDLATAARLMDEGLQLLRPFGDTPELAELLFDRGVLAVNQDDATKARPLLEEDLVLYQKFDQEWFQAMILLHLGNVVLSQGDVAAAQTYMAQCHTLGQEIGDRWILASAVNNFGEMARYQGDYQQAEGFYLESRDLFQTVKSSPDVARADHSLGWVALSGNEPGRARTLFEAALDVHEQLGVKRGVVECLVGLAAVSGVRGEAEKAARLMSFTRRRFAQLGAGIWPADTVDFERNLSRIKAQLDRPAFDAAWNAGQSMTLRQALVDAARSE